MPKKRTYKTKKNRYSRSKKRLYKKHKKVRYTRHHKARYSKRRNTRYKKRIHTSKTQHGGHSLKLNWTNTTKTRNPFFPQAGINLVRGGIKGFKDIANAWGGYPDAVSPYPTDQPLIKDSNTFIPPNISAMQLKARTDVKNLLKKY